MKIYLACGLTHVPRNLFDDYTDFIHALAGRLTNDRGHRVKYALINSDPQLASKPINERARLCYFWDREMVEDADLVIAEASFPSIGLGIEMQLAEMSGTPIIVCFRDFGVNRVKPVEYTNPDHSRHELQVGAGIVSLMALGLPEIFKVIEYDSLPDGIIAVLDAVNLLEQPNS